MNNQNEIFEKVGLKVPSILLPRKNVDLKKWAVVACDQYTSEPEYWKSLSQEIGDSPSTLHLVFPEVYLEDDDKESRIEKINAVMEEYLRSQVLEEHSPAFFLVRRETPDSPARWGLIAALDLEKYDFSKGSKTLIRATEGTIIERIPPRKKIRINAPIEIPHIMVLIDDPAKSVIEPLVADSDSFEQVYDFDLMKNGGHVKGYKIQDEKSLNSIAEALLKLADPKAFSQKYGVDDVLLFAMGDGNHSLATAKSAWEDIKAAKASDPSVMDHPARWALVEIENIYDEGLIFEPIHRVVFNSTFEEFKNHLSEQGKVEFEKVDEIDDIISKVAASGSAGNEETQIIGYTDADTSGVFLVKGSKSTIPAGTAQAAIDTLVSEGTASVDYIHGTESTSTIGRRKNNFAIFLPALDKADFFRTVVNDGALPRKTFSMGEANEKRYYIEARKIKMD